LEFDAGVETLMKVEVTEVSATQKSFAVEIPPEVVGSEIEKVTRGYAKSLRLPGFRPGKIPPKVIRQRFKQQILHDVAHDLIPRTVDGLLRERGLEPIDAPDVKDVQIEEGAPLTFTAAIETAPPVDPGSYASLTIRRPPVTVSAEQGEQALTRLREGLARFKPVEDRPSELGDTVVMNMTRQTITAGEPSGDPEKLDEVGVEIGATANPPGFDEQLLGVTAGTEKTFRVTFPADYSVESLAGTELEYSVSVTALRRKDVPTADDEFAKDLGYESLEELRKRVDENLTREAQRTQERNARQELLEQLAKRVPFDVPEVLVARETDRRVEEFVRQLIDQRIDPMKAEINWEEFRTQQREPAVDTVKCMLVLDEIARRETLVVEDAEIDAEIARYAQQANQPVATVRHRLEHEGAISRIYAGLRREKAIDFALAQATVLEA
jgi:trigger factor